MKTLTESQILKLSPEFKLYPQGMTVVEWFEVYNGQQFYTINSGLKHADGITESPYKYSTTFIGRGRKKKSLEAFTKFWQQVNSEPWYTVMTFPTRYRIGFTSSEVTECCEKLDIKEKDFWLKFGTNTCAVIEGESIFYHTDVLRTFHLVMEKRELTLTEFD